MDQSKKIDFNKLLSIWCDSPAVIAVWIFGSAREGHVSGTSDLDIGVLFSRDPTVDELLDLQSDIQAGTGIEDVDMVVLNKADSILAFEVISGTPIFCRDKDKRAEFASLVAREYEDSMCMISDALAKRTAPRT